MENGTFIVYTIQQRIVAEGEWCKIAGPIKPVDKYDNWVLVGNNSFASIIPHIGTGNDRRPMNRSAYKEWQVTYHSTDIHGWFDIRFAIAALKRCRQDDEAGEYDTKDGYGKLHQRIRREYRIVTVRQTFSRTVEPVSVEDLMETLV